MALLASVPLVKGRWVMKYLFMLMVLALGLSQTKAAQAQQRTAGDWAWTPIVNHEGVSFSYIFYSQANNEHNGVVLKLVNTNPYAVTYRFKMVFRSEGAAVVEPVLGTLQPLETKTGDTAGLFWIPFKDGREIAEVGLRGYTISPKPAPGSSASQTPTP